MGKWGKGSESLSLTDYTLPLCLLPAATGRGMGCALLLLKTKFVILGTHLYNFGAPSSKILLVSLSTLHHFSMSARVFFFSGAIEA